MSGNSLVVLWLGFFASTAEGLGSIPDQGTKFPQVAQPRKNKLQGYTVQHREYSQYFIITINGV